MKKINVLMVGTGEYTTGFVPNATAAADKKAGVVGISMFDLRRRGKVGRLIMAGTNGSKFPSIREHLQRVIGNTFRNMDTSFESFPGDDVLRDPQAYTSAIAALDTGDAVVVFTPDDTHFDISMAAIERGCHVLIAKPLVKKVDEHLRLRDAARERGVLVAMEVHKRWDPFYVDSRDRIRNLGDFSFFQSYMSQPKSQLETFRAWAGISSDISYYLNAHHIDFHVWSVAHLARPISVRAVAASGVARGMDIPTEDTITLIVEWLNHSGNIGIALYTSSWIAPKADVHSQQRFHYMGHAGEITTDQAHRGYHVATDESGYSSANPLFMKYAPDEDGNFAGQNGYGYRSFEAFLDAADNVRQGHATPDDFSDKLATASDTVWVTAILEAGRISLDSAGATVAIESDASGFQRLRKRQY
jgi:D-galacturonate reductase